SIPSESRTGGQDPKLNFDHAVPPERLLLLSLRVLPGASRWEACTPAFRLPRMRRPERHPSPTQSVQARCCRLREAGFPRLLAAGGDRPAWLLRDKGLR